MWQNQKFKLFAGKAEQSVEALQGFDLALIDAGVGDYNLVKVSSILPPNSTESSVIDIAPGDVLFAAFCFTSSAKKGVISSAVGIGIPVDQSNIGVIMKYSCEDRKEIAESKVRGMVLSAMVARKIAVKEVRVASSEAVCTGSDVAATIAGVALW